MTAIADSAPATFRSSTAADIISRFSPTMKTLPPPKRSKSTTASRNQYTPQPPAPATTSRAKIVPKQRRLPNRSPNPTSSFAAMARSSSPPPTPGKTAPSATSPAKAYAAPSPPISSTSTPPSNSTSNAALPSAPPPPDSPNAQSKFDSHAGSGSWLFFVAQKGLFLGGERALFFCGFGHHVA